MVLIYVQLNWLFFKDSSHYKLTEDTWTFLYDIYGGGPELLIGGAGVSVQNGGKRSLNASNSSSTFKTTPKSNTNLTKSNSVIASNNIETYLINKMTPAKSELNSKFQSNNFHFNSNHLFQVRETLL